MLSVESEKVLYLCHENYFDQACDKKSIFNTIKYLFQ